MKRHRVAFTRFGVLGSAFVGALLSVGGCVGEPEVAQERELLVEYVLPSYFVPANIWTQDVLAGCDGRLHDGPDFALARAEGEPSLGVVVDRRGRAVCVDTWQAIQLELDRIEGNPHPDPMQPLPAHRRP